MVVKWIPWHVKIRFDSTEEVGFMEGAVIPQPLDHRWWRQMMHGLFIDIIFDCPYDLHELTGSRYISELLRTLNDNQREVLYYRAIRQWSPQKIAAMRGQTDRNIRKVYDTLIEGLRKKLFYILLPKYEANQSLTLTQREFVRNHMEKYGDKKPRKKKSALDGGIDK